MLQENTRAYDLSQALHCGYIAFNCSCTLQDHDEDYR